MVSTFHYWILWEEAKLPALPMPVRIAWWHPMIRRPGKVCDRYKIPYTGTIGILIASCRDGQLTADVADRLLEKMVNAGFYSPVQRISDV